MNEQILFGDAVLTNGDRLDVPAIEHETLVAVLAVDHRLAVLEEDGLVGTYGRIGNELVDTVGEDNAVAKHLDNGCALVTHGGFHSCNAVLDVSINGTCEECTARTDAKLCWAERILNGSPR